LKAVADAGSVLRAHVEGWSEDSRELAVVADACAAEGFRPVTPPRSYAHTLWIDLGPAEEQLLASFSRSCRLNITATARKGFEVRPVRDEKLAHRLRELHQASFARTGGSAPHVDWAAAIRASASHPDLVRIEGLHPVHEGDSNLIAFAMAFNHGDVAEYGFAGSERVATANIPLLYAPVWSLMRWARGLGARWWDFGGVPSPESGQADPRAGIADFKRYFGGTVVSVGSEWVYQPRPVLGRMAAWLGAAARRKS
jgi:lipid II:glycine glycyltransferase (peptidoglycan interpeptide bridge formation enzyme)